MTPYIQQNVIGNAPQHPISEAEFVMISEARVALSAAFGLEESYDLLIGNYVEVERELLAAAAGNAVRDLNEYQDFFELRSTINRRVVNLLTATRLYLDQTPQRLTDCAEDSEFARTEFKQRSSEHYDKSFSYRFMEALRNHVQHCGLAVHRVSYNSRWVNEDAERVMELSVQPFAERHYLAEDAKFKATVLAEMPEKVVLTLAIREYLQCIGNLHLLVRGHVASRVARSREVIQAHISRYAEENKGVTIGIAAFACGSNGQQEILPLFLGWDDVREKLVSRNSGLVALGRHVVTGRAK